MPPDDDNADFAKSANEKSQEYLQEKTVGTFRRRPVNTVPLTSAATTTNIRRHTNTASLPSVDLNNIASAAGSVPVQVPIISAVSSEIHKPLNASATPNENLEDIAPAAGPEPLMEEPPVPEPQTRVLVDVPATPPGVNGFTFHQRPSAAYVPPPVTTQIDVPQVQVYSSPEMAPQMEPAAPLRPLPPLTEETAPAPLNPHETVQMPPPPPPQQEVMVPPPAPIAPENVMPDASTHIETANQQVVQPTTQTYVEPNSSLKVSTMSATDFAKKLSIDTPAITTPAPAAIIPPIEPVVPPQVEAATTEQLNPETQKILDSLPQYSDDQAVQSAPIAPIGIARENKGISLKNTEVMKQEEATGIDLEEKKPDYDISYDLEKAYEALIAGKTEEAVRIYEGALDADPNNTMALFGLATTYHRLGLLDQARPLYGKLLRLDPYNREALNNFLALVGEEAPNAAIVQLEKLEDANPDFSPIPAQLSILYQRLGDKDKAIDKMVKAASLSPENLVYKYNLAILYDQKGEAAPAIALYQQLLAAHDTGLELPSSVDSIQERLTFLASNYKG